MAGKPTRWRRVYGKDWHGWVFKYRAPLPWPPDWFGPVVRGVVKPRGLSQGGSVFKGRWVRVRFVEVKHGR